MSDAASFPLICPACDQALSPVTAGKVTVDYCQRGCGGVWFDHFELNKFDEADEVVPPELLLPPDLAREPVDENRRRRCPRCPDIVMRRHRFQATGTVVVDDCPNCGGYWLDAGELAIIRKEFPTAEARQSAREQYVANLAKQNAPVAGAAGLDSTRRARTLDSLLRMTGARYR